ncbi:unnamed protein product [Auanema sp. JU1783]|nr:unnamed protein product [Auanema sp. JU1783]
MSTATASTPTSLPTTTSCLASSGASTSPQPTSVASAVAAAAAAVAANSQSSPFGHFSYLFPQQQFAFHHQQQQRLKLKRQRQRVDAGEPRNSYQGAKTGMTSSESLSGLFPWMSQTDVDYVKEESNTDLSSNNEQMLEIADTSDELELQLDVENTDDRDDSELTKDEEPTHDSPVSTTDSTHSGSSSTTSTSSSKRKQNAPQRNLAESLGFDIGTQETPEEITVSVGGQHADSPPPEDMPLRERAENRQDLDSMNPLEKLSALQSQLNTPILSDMMDAQKRMFNLIEQQQQQIKQEKRPPIRDFNQLAQALKNEISENLSVVIDKIVKDWAAEMARNAAADVANRQPINNMFVPFAQPNPLFGLNATGASGIFPNFNGFNPLAAFNQLRRPYSSSGMLDDEGASRRKRAKVTDSVRKVNGGTPVRAESPSSLRSSPQLNMSQSTPMSYFPPTMVGHPLYGGATFGDREDSPTNSDDNSDCGPYDGNQSSTLTPMHLRKAKLMFFYTRYPNSALLKSYFPDIRFNKNNTAQLVKWFSNFREFYYIQMEKYARQALAEGVRSRDEIHVTMDSEIFKTLNQHYNRNNHIQPPERLVSVVQESLREFFDAIRTGKDSEPSWKKTIYKIINRMDDQIPDYFKEPNFLERLE